MATKMIPVGDMTELPSTSIRSQLPLNSPEAQAYRAGALPPAAAATPELPRAIADARAPTGIRGVLGSVAGAARSVGSGVLDVAKGVAPVLAGTLGRRALGAGLADNTVSGPVAEPLPGAPRTGAAAIPTAAEMGAPQPVAPAQEPANWLRDTGVGRNVNNTINAVGGSLGGGMLRTGMAAFPAGSAAARAAGFGTFAGTGIRAAAADAAAGAPQLPSGPGQPAYSNEGRAAADAPAEVAVDAPAEVAVDQPGIRQQGAPLPTATHEALMATARATDVWGPGAHNADGTGGMTGFADNGSFGANSAHNKNFDAEVARGKADEAIRLGGRKGVEAAGVIMSGIRDKTANSSAEAIARTREQGETTRATAANKNQADIHAATNATTIRGQDAALMGHKMTNDVAVANGIRTQGNADRSYDLDVKKVGIDTANKSVERRAAAAKALPEEIAHMLPLVDGKPDLANAARHAQGLTHVVAELMRNSKNPAEKAEFDRDGMSALSPSFKARVVAGMQLADVANATSTSFLTPWGTTAIKSNAPIMAIRKLETGDYETDRRGVNGEREIIPGRYIEKEGSLMSFGGQASNKFKALMVQ